MLQALSNLIQVFQYSRHTLQHAISEAERRRNNRIQKLDITNTVEEATAQKPVQVLSLITDIDHFNKTVVANLEERLNKGLGSAE